MEGVFKVPVIFSTHTEWRLKFISVNVYEMGIIFEGLHKILALFLVVQSYEMLTSVLLHHYFKSGVSRFRSNRYITKGFKEEIHGIVK